MHDPLIFLESGLDPFIFTRWILFHPGLLFVQGAGFSFPTLDVGKGPGHVVDFFVGWITFDKREVTVVNILVVRLEVL